MCAQRCVSTLFIHRSYESPTLLVFIKCTTIAVYGHVTQRLLFFLLVPDVSPVHAISLGVHCNNYFNRARYFIH